MSICRRTMLLPRKRLWKSPLTKTRCDGGLGTTLVGRRSSGTGRLRILAKLMQAYCRNGPGQGLQASQVRFMVNGAQIAAADTAEKLGLVDGDVIVVSIMEEVT